MPADTDGPSPPGTWTKRRRIIHLALIYIAVLLAYLVERRPEAAITLTLAPTLVAAGLGIIGTYVAGAVRDDNNARTAKNEAH